MRTISSLLFACLLFLAACKKNYVPPPGSSLDGQWKLISVKDKNTGLTYFRLAGSSGDIIISISGNKFSGHTLRNTFSEGIYGLQNQTDLLFGSFTMTKVAEDEWGGMFLTVLNACLLQSVSPCAPSKISLQGNVLVIESPLRYDLTLMRN